MFFKKKKTVPEHRVLPRHIAIIMDGNGRWAKKRALPRTAGHAAGGSTFKTIARYCNKIGIEYLTVYAFSTENWKRPKDEIDNIMNILRDYLKDTDELKGENIRLEFIGDRTPLADDLKELMLKAEKDSANATGLHLNIALNYGGRDEIVHAVKSIVKEGIAPEDITEQTISDRLYTAGQPDPDFIIRPSGEYRLSNYLIWQAAYSEYWFSDILWPDFTPKDLEKAIDDFSLRNRRFGGV
ncbi:MAG: isoprenyl transferase [Clostridia bacterium]|nr:isoprenyl transferase [Clostridia bacterium]